VKKNSVLGELGSENERETEIKGGRWEGRRREGEREVR
jgi:hypothetical protein